MTIFKLKFFKKYTHRFQISLVKLLIKYNLFNLQQPLLERLQELYKKINSGKYSILLPKEMHTAVSNLHPLFGDFKQVKFIMVFMVFFYIFFKNLPEMMFIFVRNLQNFRTFKTYRILSYIVIKCFQRNIWCIFLSLIVLMLNKQL